MENNKNVDFSDFIKMFENVKSKSYNPITYIEFLEKATNKINSSLQSINVNFTIEKSNIEHWIDEEDFELIQNSHDYLEDDKLSEELSKINKFFKSTFLDTYNRNHYLLVEFFQNTKINLDEEKRNLFTHIIKNIYFKNSEFYINSCDFNKFCFEVLSKEITKNHLYFNTTLIEERNRVSALKLKYIHDFPFLENWSTYLKEYSIEKKREIRQDSVIQNNIQINLKRSLTKLQLIKVINDIYKNNTELHKNVRFFVDKYFRNEFNKQISNKPDNASKLPYSNKLIEVITKATYNDSFYNNQNEFIEILSDIFLEGIDGTSSKQEYKNEIKRCLAKKK